MVCHMIICLLVGVAGVGKTHVKRLLLGLPPPPVRVSTPLAEPPIRAISLSVGTADKKSRIWKAVEQEDFDRMFFGAIKEGKRLFELPPQASQSHSPADPDLTTAVADDISDHKASGSEQRVPQRDPILSDLESELLDLVSNTKESKEIFEVSLVYLLDSGGQAQFQEILPVFIKHALAVFLVTNLSERLDDCPLMPYYNSSGKCISKERSSLTNKEILTRYFQVMQSRQFVHSEGEECAADTRKDLGDLKGGEGGPNVFVIGTHKDKVDYDGNTIQASQHHPLCHCFNSFERETIAEKNKTLLPMACRCFGEKLGVYRAGENDKLIFPVNAKRPDDEDRHLAQELRKRVGEGQEVRIPLSWFAFEMFLRKRADKSNVKILSVHECYEVGELLHMDHNECEAALIFLSKLNVLFYDPKHLPGVVFVTSQVLLSIVTALVYRSQMLRGKVVEEATGCTGVWLDFRDYGLLTAELLNSREFKELLSSKGFEVQYRPDVFSPADLLDLLKHLQIVAQVIVGSKDYIMPCLLPELPHGEVDIERKHDSPLPVAPLLIRYQEKCLPAGIFTLLVAFLQNKAKWMLTLNDNERPKCLHRNCTKFKLPTGKHGTVTLILSVEYLEVHVRSPSSDACREACPRIADDIFRGLEEVAKILGYTKMGTTEKTFFCLCDCGNPHPTGISEDGYEWSCPKSETVGGKLSTQHKVWLNAGMC